MYYTNGFLFWMNIYQYFLANKTHFPLTPTEVIPVLFSLLPEYTPLRHSVSLSLYITLKFITKKHLVFLRKTKMHIIHY